MYLWVDGSDPVWLARKNEFLSVAPAATGDANCKGRYENNDELKYSLRSAEKHLPWIRNIFIVTDGQIPVWLDTSNPKVRIIDHKEILPAEALPCYNSVVLEYFLYRIPGLAEHFLYANDDMLVGADLSPDFFFAPDGYPIVRLKRKCCGRLSHRLRMRFAKRVTVYRQTIDRAAKLIENKFGKYHTGHLHHNIDAYRKSDLREVVENAFAPEIAAVVTNHIRDISDIQRVLFAYHALETGRGHLKYVDKNESLRISLQRSDYMKYMRIYRPKLFCLNDTQYTTDEDRKRVRPFLESLFPKTSAFEK